MKHYTVQDPFGKRVTVPAVGVESAKVLARHELGLHPSWPVTVALRPDPPGLRRRTRLMTRAAVIVPSKILEVM